MKEIVSFFNNIGRTLPTITVIDIIDILLVAFVIYAVINLIHTTSAAKIAKAIILLLLLTLLTDLVNLHAMNYILDKILELGFVALVIVFQPELRRMLEKVGGRSITELLVKPSSADDTENAITQAVAACEIMSNEKTGVLIVFERDNSLEQICKTGTTVDAAVSQELIRNIFFPKASLHDGAMIIRNGRIEAAGCVLPLSENRHLSTDLGTRHRAGVGMSEASDAVVLIVSEETGTMSVAIGGMLKRHLAPETLERMLRKELIREQTNQENVFRRLLRKKKKTGGNDNAKT
ncbi:MAG: diadenylate cyclase CdaA [Firmicutes bacterium]|nr:diadenylate cyclase CdaA [Bacillota bacterium]MDY2719898.1 diadenylate cyclase CdaA [Candidatus Faecousia sp.]